MITHRPSPFRALLATALLALALAPLALHAAPPPLIPLEVLFADSQMRSVQLSPDGSHLAFLTTLGTGKIGIALMDLQSGKIEPLVAAKDENIKFYVWKGNDRIVYGGDLGGNESNALRAITLSKRKAIELANSHQANLDDNADTASILDNLKFDNQHVLIIGRKGVGTWTGGVYLLDVQYGDRAKAPGADVEGAFGLMGRQYRPHPLPRSSPGKRTSTITSAPTSSRTSPRSPRRPLTPPSRPRPGSPSSSARTTRRSTSSPASSAIPTGCAPTTWRPGRFSPGSITRSRVNSRAS